MCSCASIYAPFSLTYIMQAQKDEECGNDVLAKKKRRGLLVLKIIPIVCLAISVICVIISFVIIAVTTGTAAKAATAN